MVPKELYTAIPYYRVWYGLGRIVTGHGRSLVLRDLLGVGAGVVQRKYCRQRNSLTRSGQEGNFCVERTNLSVLVQRSGERQQSSPALA